MRPRRRLAIAAAAGAAAAALALGGAAFAAVSGDDLPPDYGVPAAQRTAAYCADRVAFWAAIDQDLPALAAGRPVLGEDVRRFLADHQDVVFRYEENAVPDAGAAPPAQVAWMHEVASTAGPNDPGRFVDLESDMVLWAARSC